LFIQPRWRFLVLAIALCLISYTTVVHAETWEYSGDCEDNYWVDKPVYQGSMALYITGNPTDKVFAVNTEGTRPRIGVSYGSYGANSGTLKLKNWDGYWNKSHQAFLLVKINEPVVSCVLKGPTPPGSNSQNDISGSTSEAMAFIGTWVFSSKTSVNVNTMSLNQDGTGSFKAFLGNNVTGNEYTYKIVWQIQNGQLIVNFVDAPASNRVFSNRSDGTIIDQWNQIYLKK